jgi:hypothetical protein
MAFDTSKDINHEMHLNNSDGQPVAETDKLGNNAHDDLSADPNLEGLTLYEKKAFLINRELDRQGMGRCESSVDSATLQPPQHTDLIQISG